jgi:NAD(P)-dependent dehydrogenase (short-subunit alcohol dehydrogenase family)
MSQVWFITGANRGLGAAIARAALDAGHRIVAAVRNRATTAADFGIGEDRLLPVEIDLVKPASINAAVDLAVSTFGRIDVLVNNAGYGQLGAFEESLPEDISRQFDTNVFGLMNVTRAVLPIMREQRSGQVFNVSSMAGYKGGDRYSIYAASKFAVVGFSESLSEELAEFGIRVTVVEPGYFRTDFLDSSSVAHGSKAIADYAASSAAKRARSDKSNHQQQGDPAKLGKALVSLASESAPPVHFPVGSDAIQWVEKKNAAVQADVERFRSLSIATAFPTA